MRHRSVPFLGIAGLSCLLLSAGVRAAVAGQADEDPSPRPDAAAPLQDESDPPGQHGFTPPGRRLRDQSGDRPFFDLLGDIDRAQVREFMLVHFPEEAEELRVLERVNRRAFMERMRNIMPRILRLIRELERDEQLGLLSIEEERLELQIHRAVRAYTQTGDERKRLELREEIRSLIAEQFAKREQRARRNIEKLEERIARLKERIELQGEQKQQIIDRELEMRLSSPADLRGDRPARRDRPHRNQPLRGRGRNGSRDR